MINFWILCEIFFLYLGYKWCNRALIIFICLFVCKTCQRPREFFNYRQLYEKILYVCDILEK